MGMLVIALGHSPFGMWRDVYAWAAEGVREDRERERERKRTSELVFHMFEGNEKTILLASLVATHI